MTQKIIVPLAIMTCCLLVSVYVAGNQPETGKEYNPKGTRGGPMVYVPAGKFQMGCNRGTHKKCVAEYQPLHEVDLNAYYIDKYEVTIEQYEECVRAGKCRQAHFDDGKCWVLDTGGKKFKYPGYAKLPERFRGKNQPVLCIDWYQARAYCKYAGKRLPTEAEWEKAARGMNGKSRVWGDEKPDCTFAVMRDKNKDGCGKNATWPVGSKPKGVSHYGAMDMSGNVLEWTADWFGRNYYKKSPKRNPKGPSRGKGRVLRGGYWATHHSQLWTYTRYWRKNPKKNNNSSGCRCAKSP